MATEETATLHCVLTFLVPDTNNTWVYYKVTHREIHLAMVQE